MSFEPCTPISANPRSSATNKTILGFRVWAVAAKGTQTEIDTRLQRFMDHESRIEKSQNDWLDKQEKIKSEYKLLNDAEMKILRKESDIRSRIAELNRYRDSLKLKQKQLAVEKKQVQLEMKKAKLEMKVAGNK